MACKIVGAEKLYKIKRQTQPTPDNRLLVSFPSQCCPYVHVTHRSLCSVQRMQGAACSGHCEQSVLNTLKSAQFSVYCAPLACARLVPVLLYGCAPLCLCSLVAPLPGAGPPVRQSLVHYTTLHGQSVHYSASRPLAGAPSTTQGRFRPWGRRWADRPTASAGLAESRGINGFLAKFVAVCPAFPSVGPLARPC